MAAAEDFAAALAAASTAIDSADWTTARRQCLKARIALAQMPNVGADGVSASWRNDLDAIEKSINMESGRTTRSVTVGHEFAA